MIIEQIFISITFYVKVDSSNTYVCLCVCLCVCVRACMRVYVCMRECCCCCCYFPYYLYVIDDTRVMVNEVKSRIFQLFVTFH